jgi:hypothetical protein
VSLVRKLGVRIIRGHSQYKEYVKSHAKVAAPLNYMAFALSLGYASEFIDKMVLSTTGAHIPAADIMAAGVFIIADGADGSPEGSVRKASCAQCSSSFQLIPPADTDYTIPKEKRTSQDYLKREYECEANHHVNTIYWQRYENQRDSLDKPTRRRRAYNDDELITLMMTLGPAKNMLTKFSKAPVVVIILGEKMA